MSWTSLYLYIQQLGWNGKFLEKHKLQNWLEEIGKLNSPVSIKYIDLIVKNFFSKKMLYP